MSIYDRWHLSHPTTHPRWNHKDPEKRLTPCKCGRGKNKLYPTVNHGCGKRWQVRWREDNKRQGKQNFAERYGDDPEQHAEAYDAQVTNDLNTDSYITPERAKITLGEFAAEWRAGLTGDSVSLEGIDRRLKHIRGTDDDPTPIAKTPISKLAKRPSMIQQWVKSLQNRGLAPGYIRDIRNTLSSVFIAAIDDGIAHKNPTRSSSVQLPPLDETLIEPWTPGMVAAARGELEERKDCGAMADLGAGAGLRQGEIFGVAEEDIVFLGRKQNRKIKVRRQVKLVKDPETDKHVPVFAPPKRGKTRDVPLSDVLGRKLSAHIEANSPRAVTLPWKKPDGKPVTVKLLFVRPDGKAWHRKNFEYLWRAARRKAGAEATRANGMHVLRHSYASLILHKGVDVIKLAAWLGHTDPGFTLRYYGHFIPDLADLGREAVDEFLEPGEGEEGGSNAAGDVP
ncbi:hypothetical protein GCM10022254_09000 [Actinomadura meridiana]|uniref:Integrase n=1 Tax=Actinomadura meridiana TaxID=559626 RepID=A0ABP8BTN4_9ACTN